MRKVGFAEVVAMTGDMTREEWLLARSHGVGGSDVAQICGVSNWGNALKVYLSKVDPLFDNDEQSESAEIGTFFEDAVAEFWMKRHPTMRLERVNAILQHPDLPWAFANIDRVVIDRESNEVIGIYEGKTSGMKNDWADDTVPDDYQLQGQWYLAVSGLPKIYYGALLGGFGGMTLADPDMEADPEMHEDLFKVCGDFWQMVIDKTPPAVDASASSDMVLKHLFGTDSGETIELEHSLTIKLAAYLDAKATTKDAEKHEKLLGNEIKMEMGDAAAATCGSFAVKWPTYTRNSFDSKTFKADHPDLHGQYLNETKYRRFSVKETKSSG